MEIISHFGKGITLKVFCLMILVLSHVLGYTLIEKMFVMAVHSIFNMYNHP